MKSIVNKFLRKGKILFETNNIFGWLYDLIAQTILYRKLINYKIASYTKNINKSRAYNVIIETTNICNATCIMCPHTIMQRKKEVMSDKVFNHIVTRLKNENIKPLVFILNGFGEPLVDKNIFRRIKRIKNDFPNSIVKLYSNLSLANKTLLCQMLNSGLDEINISFNGYSKKNYEKTMGISYSRTLKNLEELLRLKKRTRSSLSIRISMALVSTNEGEEKKFVKKWEKKVDSVSINKVHTYGDSIKDSSGKNKINFDKTPFPCKYIWNTIVFGVRGDILLCCLDFEGKYAFGNIEKKSISDIFYSNRFNRIREMHLRNEISKIPICKHCYTPYKNGAEWLIRDLY